MCFKSMNYRQVDLEGGERQESSRSCNLTACVCFKGRKVWASGLSFMGLVGNSFGIYNLAQDDNINGFAFIAVSTTLWVSAYGIYKLAIRYTAEQNVNHLTSQVDTLEQTVQTLENELAQSKLDLENLDKSLKKKNNKLLELTEQLQNSAVKWEDKAHQLTNEFTVKTKSLVQLLNQALNSEDSSSSDYDEIEKILKEEQFAALRENFKEVLQSIKDLEISRKKLIEKRDELKIQVQKSTDVVANAAKNFSEAGTILHSDLILLDQKIAHLEQVKNLKEEIRVLRKENRDIQEKLKN